MTFPLRSQSRIPFMYIHPPLHLSASSPSTFDPHFDDVGDRRPHRHRQARINKQWGRQKADLFTAKKFEASGSAQQAGDRSPSSAPQQNHSLGRKEDRYLVRLSGESVHEDLNDFGRELESSTFGFAHVRVRPSVRRPPTQPCINRQRPPPPQYQVPLSKREPIDHRDQNAQCHRAKEDELQCRHPLRACGGGPMDHVPP